MVIRRADLWSIFLFLFSLSASAGRLTATKWADGLEICPLAALLGGIIGLALGFSRFSSLTTSILATGYTLTLLPGLLTSHQYPRLDWLSRATLFLERLHVSLRTLSTHQPLEDTFLFVLLVSSGYWLISLIGGYRLARRGEFFPTLLLAGLALLTVQTFDHWRQDGEAYLWLYLWTGLILAARLYFRQRRRAWQEGQVYLPPESIQDWNLAILLVIGVTLGLAWLMPSPDQATYTVRRLWEQIRGKSPSEETNWSRLVAGLRTESQSRYEDILPLGQEAASDPNVRFTVELPIQDALPRHYWRVRTYEIYANGEWRSGSFLWRHFSPAEAPFEVPYGRVDWELVTYTFTVQSPTALLLTPARPRWISLPAQVGWLPVKGHQGEPLWFQGYLTAGERYQVQAENFSPTEQELRAAGTDYPAWVRDRYLQLPANLSPRLGALAKELTSSATTPYDQALVITDYLRRTIRYSEHVPPPPPGQDALEWFLFDYQQGFCNYYAGAAVILLRAAGVPARLAVGYAEGEIPPGTIRRRLVRENQAHAWPEVYFPGLGWIEFEPTTAQPPLHRPAGLPRGGEITPFVRPTAILPEATGSPASLPTGPFTPSPPQPKIGWPAVGILALIVITIGLGGRRLWKRQAAAWLSLWRPHLRGFRQKPGRAFLSGLKSRLKRKRQTPIERSLSQIYRALRWLDMPSSPSQTPLEAAIALSQALPEVTPEILVLLTTALPEVYGQCKGEEQAAALASRNLLRKTRRAIWEKRLSVGQRKL